MFIIEDEIHAEPQTGEFDSFEEAYKEIERISQIPWNKPPNRCPCANWRNCERVYQIIEYDTTKKPWIELQRKNILNISVKGLQWLIDK